jgi:hypothetical protein
MSQLRFSRRTALCLTQGALLAIAASAVLVPAQADEHHERREERHEVGGERFAFHERHEHDVRRFAERDLVRWRGGRWANTCYAGRCGWWWLAGGFWYFYTAPVYPYPLFVSDAFYPDPGPVIAPPAVMAPPPPAPVAPPVAPPPTAQVWYYCDNPAGYYPYVQSCPTQFRAVPATPAAPPPPR